MPVGFRPRLSCCSPVLSLAQGVVAVVVKAAAMYWAFLDRSPGFNFAVLYPFVDAVLAGPILLIGLFLMRGREGG